MHGNSLKLMAHFLEEWHPRGALLEVGSLNVNGSYRQLFEGWEWPYIGIDQRPGPDVDIIVRGPPWPFEEALFDVVISGQTFEHVERPWLVAREIGRILKPGGLLCLIAPWNFPIHHEPLDCWRILPDGMKVLFEEAQCETLHCRIDQDDCFGVGRRLLDDPA